MHGVAIDAVDQMMDKFFGERFYHNDGSHLNGSIVDDTTWQDYWRQLIVFPGQMYNMPQDKVGKRLSFMLS
jgi:hypothetical protein